MPAKDKTYAITVTDGDRRVIVRIGPGVQTDIEDADYHFASVAELAQRYVEVKSDLDTLAVQLNGG